MWIRAWLGGREGAASRRTRKLTILLMILLAAMVILGFEIRLLTGPLTGVDPSLPFDVASLLVGFTVKLTSLLSQTGYAAVFLLMLLGSASLPVPSEIILLFAGYMVYKRLLEFWSLILWSTLGALAGSFVDYYIGFKFGRSLVTGEIKLSFISSNHLLRVERWFNRYGGAAVGLLRLVPVARTLISFPAGAYRMDKLKFTWYTVLGTLPWNIALIYLGLSFGSSWRLVLDDLRYVNYAVYAALLVFIIWLTKRFTLRRKDR